MLLRQDNATEQVITQRLSASYGWMLGDEGVDDLVEQLGDLASQAVAAALNAHSAPPNPGRGGQTVGAYPPSVADLLGHIEAAATVQRRQTKAAEQAQKYHGPALDTAVPEKHRGAWREAVAKGTRRARWRDSQLIPRLKQTVGLDCFDPIDTLAWREVVGALAKSWNDDDINLTMEQARDIYVEARERHREKTPEAEAVAA